MTIFLIIITIISVIITIIFASYKIKVNNNIKEENKRLENEKNNLLSNITSLKITEGGLQSSIEKEKEHLSTLQSDIKESLNNQTELSQKAFENYCTILENQYSEKEEEYDMYKDSLETAYSNLQFKLMQEYNECKEDLDKIKATRTAAIEAQRREKELENNISFYCIPISDADKADIGRLEALKPSLNKPRVLSMLIWQTWFQKPLKTLTANVIGADDKTGIYKITNIKTKECYIGQAVDLYWPMKNFSQRLLGVI